jgi:hypothetical protein
MIGGNKFELYGPMWIWITYACVLSISANIASYYSSHDRFTFVAEYVVKAFIVTGLFGFLVPLIIGCIVKIMKGDMPFLAVTLLINTVSLHIRLFATMVYCSNSSLLYRLTFLANRYAVFSRFLQLHIPHQKLPQLYWQESRYERLSTTHLYHSIWSCKLLHHQTDIL